MIFQTYGKLIISYGVYERLEISLFVFHRRLSKWLFIFGVNSQERFNINLMYYVMFNVSLLVLLFIAGAEFINDKDVSLTDTFLQRTQHRLNHTIPER